MKPSPRCWLSSRDGGERLAEQPGPDWHEGPAPAGPSVFFDLSRRMQTLPGFGGAFTEAAAL